MSCDIHNICIHAGVTFSLTDHDPIPNYNSGSVLITDIGGNDGDALICRSEIPTTGIENWFLHPTQISTDVNDRIAQVCGSITMLSGLFYNNYCLESMSEVHRVAAITGIHHKDNTYTCISCMLGSDLVNRVNKCNSPTITLIKINIRYYVQDMPVLKICFCN